MHKTSWTQKAKIAWILLFHRNTPLTTKTVMIGGVLYGLLPFDFIPDFLPIIGMADDATFLVIAIMLFLHLTKDMRRKMEKEKDVIDV